MKDSADTGAASSLVYGPPETAERYTSYPATAEVLGDHVSATECGAVCVPLPESEIVAGEFVALLVTVTAPEKRPTFGGENRVSKVVDWPGESVSPFERPLAAQGRPETATLETVTSEFPAFVTVTLSVPLPPATTFPKFRLGVLKVRSEVAAVPVPLSETLLGDAEALLAMEISPVKAPADFGEKTTSKVDCFPAAMTVGSEIPEIFTPAAEVLACITVTSDRVPFEIVTDCDALLPRGTSPKCKDPGSTEIAAAVLEVCGVAPVLDALVSPMQPELARARRNNSAKAENEIVLPLKLALFARSREKANCLFSSW